MSGLTPGEHGFHVHEYGVWSENGMSSGGHFNPTMAPHAGPEAKKRHVGDLGNITANKNGNATLDMDDSMLSFHGAIRFSAAASSFTRKRMTSNPITTRQRGGRLTIGVCRCCQALNTAK